MTGFNEGKILIDGNTAAALGTIFGGVTFVGWYPITPASSVVDALEQVPAQAAHRPGDRQGELRRHPGRG